MALDAEEGCTGHSEPDAEESLVPVFLICLLELLTDHRD